MKFNFCKMTILLLVMLLLSALEVPGQRIVVNSSGEKVVMYPDGSWRAFQPSDSVLVRQYVQGTDAIRSAPAPASTRRERTQGEQEEFIFRQWQETYALILQEEKDVQIIFRDATNAQFKAGELLRNAEANKRLIEPIRLATLQDDYDKAIQTLKEVNRRQKAIKSISAKAQRIREDVKVLKEKDVAKLHSRFHKYHLTYISAQAIELDPMTPAITPQPVPQTSSSPSSGLQEKEKSNTRAGKQMSPSAWSAAPMHRQSKAYITAPYNCAPKQSIESGTSARTRIELDPHLIFTHTDPDLRPYFKDNELITCRGRLSKTGPYIYLHIYFQIASSHSQINFGSLASGSLLRLKLLDGDYVSLYNLKGDRGRIDTYSGHTLFAGQYALGKNEIKKLRRSALDKMRVLWETGYEDYEVIYIDIIQQQLDCLGIKK